MRINSTQLQKAMPMPKQTNKVSGKVDVDGKVPHDNDADDRNSSQNNLRIGSGIRLNTLR